MTILSKEDLEVIEKYHAIMLRTDVQAEAKAACMENRMNGVLEGIGTGKGGRVWLDGEWQLEELDALCQYIRHTVLEDDGTPDDFTSVLRRINSADADEPPVDPKVVKAAEIAAQWWTDRVQRVHKPSFFCNLRDAIIEKLLAIDPADELEIMSDYGPDAILAAALKAGRPPNVTDQTLAKEALPWKHATYVSRDKISPKAGYGNFLPDIPVTL